MRTTNGATPLVSVCMITYNHERFIAQAIESVLMQETDFPVELVIGEDCSIDGTRAIVQEYAARYPDKIKVLLHPHNLGPPHSPGKNNFVTTLKACRGKYIALLEGDDYWTDQHKLQKQVEFLDRHLDFVACFHWTSWLDQESGRIKILKAGPPVIKAFYTIDDLLEYCNFLFTCSVMFRREALVDRIPNWYYQDNIVGDFVLFLLLAQNGGIGFLDELMAVYRRGKQGIHGGRRLSRNMESTLRTYLAFGEYLRLDQRISYNLGIANLNAQLSQKYLEEGSFLKALVASCNALKSVPHIQRTKMLRHLLYQIPILRSLKHLIRLIQKQFRKCGRN